VSAGSHLTTSEPMPGSSARPLPERDLDHVLEHTCALYGSSGALVHLVADGS
jgi:hypothetical protein